jgi:hypothetical protein
MQLRDLADPAAVERVRAWVAEQERLEAMIVEHPEYQRLHILAERTPEQQKRYLELGAKHGFDGAGATPERMDEAQARRDRDEQVSLDEAVMLDAAYRASIPRNRQDWRFMRSPQGRKLSARVFRQARTYDRALPRRAPRAQTRRRTVRTSRGSPRREDPEPHPDVASRSAVAA